MGSFLYPTIAGFLLFSIYFYINILHITGFFILALICVVLVLMHNIYGSTAVRFNEIRAYSYGVFASSASCGTVLCKSMICLFALAFLVISVHLLDT